MTIQPRKEFIAMMAMMTALGALAIDGMLPAFPLIGQEFAVSSADHLHLIVSVLFIGFAVGQLVYGPLSDVYGRKPMIYWGIAVFVVGALISAFAPSLEILLLGRLLQGFGSAGPRIVSLALIRDQYAGDTMARITSLVMTVFILVPAIAPALGQGVMIMAGWRAIFSLLVILGLIVWVWFGLRQPETLSADKRKKLAWSELWAGTKQTFSYSTTVYCTIVAGILFGVFIGYLGAVQTIFDKLFHAADLFPAYFAILALSIGSASFFNSKLVMAMGTRKLVWRSLVSLTTIAGVFLLYMAITQSDTPPLWIFMIYLMATFFAVGFLFGNLNAMAMEPLGNLAGIGAAIIGFAQNLLSIPLGIFLGQFFHLSVAPLAISFAAVGVAGLIIMSKERKLTRSRQLPA